MKQYIVTAIHKPTKKREYISKTFTLKSEANEFVKREKEKNKQALPQYVYFTDFQIVEIQSKQGADDELTEQIEKLSDTYTPSDILEELVKSVEKYATPTEKKDFFNKMIDTLTFEGGYMVLQVETQKDMEMIESYASQSINQIKMFA